MQNIDRLTLTEMQELVKGSGRLGLSVEGRAAAYGLIQRVLGTQRYQRISKACQGIVRRFLTKVTGLSRAQMSRLIRRWNQSGRLERRKTTVRNNGPRARQGDQGEEPAMEQSSSE